jgi:iron complex outermembrane receptor protein
MTQFKRTLMLATALALCGGAQAQGASSNSEEIVVTAQKRAENIQDVPISLEVVSNELIEDLHIVRFEDLQKYVPNFTVQPTPGANQIYIRGIGSGAQNFAFEQSVSLYVDGIYAGRNRQFMAPFFDVERIEVLRGPQGALVGKNTAAGAISLISAQPQEEFSAMAEASMLLDRSGYSVSGYVTGSISDSVTARLAVKLVDQDGWVYNRHTAEDVPHEDDSLIRGILRYEPSENFDLTAKIEYTDYSVYGTNAIAFVGGSDDDFENGEKAAEPPFGERERDLTESFSATVVANYYFGEYTLTSTTGYSEYDARKYTGAGSSVPELWLSIQGEDFSQWSQEVRLASPVGQPVEFIVGAYVDTNDLTTEFVNRYRLLGGVLAGEVNQVFEQTTDTWSVFGQAKWNITEELKLLGSLRYTENSKDASYDFFRVAGVPLGPPIYLEGSRSKGTLDPSITVQYHFTDDIMAYATYSQGSKAGGFSSNTRTVTALTFEFDDETSRNYEIGVKTKLFDGAVIANLTAFHTEFEDLQVSNYLPVIGIVIGNAASATTEGFEFSGSWYITDELELGASVAYLDATYDDFPGGPCLWNAPAGCVSQDIGGTTIPNTSKWSGSVTGRYETDINESLKASLALIATFRSKYYVEANLHPDSMQDGYTKLDAVFQLAAIDDKWSIELFGRNLTDEHTFNFSYFWPFDVGHRLKYLQETRTIGVTARVQF